MYLSCQRLHCCCELRLSLRFFSGHFLFIPANGNAAAARRLFSDCFIGRGRHTISQRAVRPSNGGERLLSRASFGVTITPPLCPRRNEVRVRRRTSGREPELPAASELPVLQSPSGRQCHPFTIRRVSQNPPTATMTRIVSCVGIKAQSCDRGTRGTRF